jgi:hypothetical protein
MTPEQFELYYILGNQKIAFRERYSAMDKINKELWDRKIEASDIPHFYQSILPSGKALDQLNRIGITQIYSLSKEK